MVVYTLKHIKTDRTTCIVSRLQSAMQYGIGMSGRDCMTYTALMLASLGTLTVAYMLVFNTNCCIIFFMLRIAIVSWKMKYSVYNQLLNFL